MYPAWAPPGSRESPPISSSTAILTGGVASKFDIRIEPIIWRDCREFKGIYNCRISIRSEKIRSSSGGACHKSVIINAAAALLLIRERKGGVPLKPPAHDHLLFRIKRHRISPVRVQIAIKRILPAAEREEGHRRRDSHIHPHHPHLDARCIFARALAIRRKDRRGVAERRPIHQRDGFIQVLHPDHA